MDNNTRTIVKIKKVVRLIIITNNTISAVLQLIALWQPQSIISIHHSKTQNKDIKMLLLNMQNERRQILLLCSTVVNTFSILHSIFSYI